MKKYRIKSKVRFSLFISILVLIFIGATSLMLLVYSQASDVSEIPKRKVVEEPEVVNQKYDLTEEDKHLLLKIAMAEAEGEDTEGKALVMLVVLNRVESNEFPDTVKDVIYSNNGKVWQFEPVQNGRFDKVTPNEDCYKALDMIQRLGYDESQGATYFISGNVKNTWHDNNLICLFVHKNHTFYC